MNDINRNESYNGNYSGKKDDGGVGWWVLGCCIPVVGLILWLVWKDEKPNTASAVGKGALISTIVMIVGYILLFVIGIALEF